MRRQNHTRRKGLTALETWKFLGLMFVVGAVIYAVEGDVAGLVAAGFLFVFFFWVNRTDGPYGNE